MNAVEFFFALSAVSAMTIAIYLWTRFVYSFDRQPTSATIIDSEAQSAAPSAQDVSASRVHGPRAQDS